MRMTKHQLATLSGTTIETVEVWIEQEWLVPGEDGEGGVFSEIDVARIRFIRSLQDDIGANSEGIGVILHLTDQIHGLRRALDELRREMPPRQ